ncbi:hypothetical protein [Psychrobacter urativorans]|uniref:Uncharacterized protein n=1 Tax=Psychrobacter urativorans TaxID=45610 RepID=A0A0M5MJL6_9GAMM|nr:hypothetical protein [Psychrobacter urativorans]ALF59550.1 hypothetical protein AOC03_05370 [Psychrobacter urativorans]
MNHSTLAELDSSLYPQVWSQHTFTDAQSLLLAMLNGSITPDPYAFTQILQDNEVYQDWINATVFGRYIQRSFATFYQQTEDSFNVELPELFRHELHRYGQYLPLGQILFVAGNIPERARREKLFTTTINPATAVLAAQQLHQSAFLNTKKSNTQAIVINQIRVIGRQVLGFPLRHNKRTSERIRNEVLILDFNDLRLVDEQIVNKEKCKEGESNIALLENNSILLRFYELR